VFATDPTLSKIRAGLPYSAGETVQVRFFRDGMLLEAKKCGSCGSLTKEKKPVTEHFWQQVVYKVASHKPKSVSQFFAMDILHFDDELVILQRSATELVIYCRLAGIVVTISWCVFLSEFL
jgi:hypothetical protein